MLKPLKKYSDISNLYLYTTIMLFLTLLVWIVIFKANVSYIPMRFDLTKAMSLEERFNLGNYPFKNLFECPDGHFLGRLKEHFLNILAFLPFGILLPFVIKKKYMLIVPIIFIAATLGFESFQLFTGLGGFDITDIITNTLGGFLGLWLYRIAFLRMPDHSLNRLSFVVNLIATPFAIYAIYNTIIHIDYYI